MTKKTYMQPAMTVTDFDLKVQILTSSVQTTGLGDDNLGYDKNGGNQGNAWSRRRGNSVWDDDEEE